MIIRELGEGLAPHSPHDSHKWPGALISVLLFCAVGVMSFAAVRLNMVFLLPGAGIFVLLVAGCYANIQRAFLGLVAVSILLPLDVAVRMGELPRIGPTRVFMGAFFVACLLRIFSQGRVHEHAKTAFPLLGIICFYAFAAFLSAINGVAPLVSLYAIIGREIFEQFVMFYVFIYFLSIPGFWKKLKSTLYIVTVLVCLFAFAEQIARTNPFMGFFQDAWLDFRAGLLRCRSTFFHPIALGCYLQLIIPIIVIDFVEARISSTRVLYGVLLALTAITSVFTVSRGPWMALAASLAILFLWKNRGHIPRMFVTGVALLLVFIFAAIAYNTNDAFHRLFRPFIEPSLMEVEGSTELYRITVVQAVLNTLEGSRKIFGFGPNAFHLAGVEASYLTHTRILAEPDQHYARILLEYGFVGTTITIAMLFVGVQLCYRGVRDSLGRSRSYAIAALSSVVGFILVNFTVSMFPQYPLGMLYWMMIAIAFSMPFTTEEGTDARSHSVSATNG